eukprot:11397601-Alexandrium_andersonii.AAC.1
MPASPDFCNSSRRPRQCGGFATCNSSPTTPATAEVSPKKSGPRLCANLSARLPHRRGSVGGGNCPRVQPDKSLEAFRNDPPVDGVAHKKGVNDAKQKNRGPKRKTTKKRPAKSHSSTSFKRPATVRASASSSAAPAPPVSTSTPSTRASQ